MGACLRLHCFYLEFRVKLSKTEIFEEAKAHTQVFFEELRMDVESFSRDTSF
jgi:hypothetical protein